MKLSLISIIIQNYIRFNEYFRQINFMRNLPSLFDVEAVLTLTLPWDAPNAIGEALAVFLLAP